MLKKATNLRNRNILLAVDVLLQSKSSFMNVFLMGFMMQVSMRNSPTSFIVYSILRYTLMGVISLLLARAFSRRPLAFWRLSMLCSILELVCVILLREVTLGAIALLALFSACESCFYWRPKLQFDIETIKNAEYKAFKGLSQILIEIAKIIMPIVLGLVISESGFQQSAYYILTISATQFILSIFYHPTLKRNSRQRESLGRAFRFIVSHLAMRKLMFYEFLRGIVYSSGLYIVISQIMVYRLAGNELDIGIFTSCGSILAILLILARRKKATKVASNRANRIHTSICALIAISMPILAYFYQASLPVIVAFYVVGRAVVESCLNSVLSVGRIEEILGKHVKNPVERSYAECFGEAALSTGRVLAHLVVLALLFWGTQSQLLFVCAVTTLVTILPFIFLSYSQAEQIADAKV